MGIGETILTAGFARRFVNGKRRVPAPPPRITAATVLAFFLSTSLSLGCILCLVLIHVLASLHVLMLLRNFCQFWSLEQI